MSKPIPAAVRESFNKVLELGIAVDPKINPARIQLSKAIDSLDVESSAQAVDAVIAADAALSDMAAAQERAELALCEAIISLRGSDPAPEHEPQLK